MLCWSNCFGFCHVLASVLLCLPPELCLAPLYAGEVSEAQSLFSPLDPPGTHSSPAGQQTDRQLQSNYNPTYPQRQNRA